MRTARLAALLAVIAITPPAVSQEPTTPCPADRGVGADWRLVRSQGFSYCVPGHWQPEGRARPGSDPQRWTAGGGSVSSGRGAARTQRSRETVMVSGEELNRMVEESRAWVTSRSVIDAGELRLDLTTTRNSRTGRTTITADWSGSRGNFLLRDETGAESPVLMQIVRTIRPQEASGG
jgi:hypothetical protein